MPTPEGDAVLVPLIAPLLVYLVAADLPLRPHPLHTKQEHEDTINIIAVVTATENLAVPVRLLVQATQIRAFADIDKLYPHGKASMNSWCNRNPAVAVRVTGYTESTGHEEHCSTLVGLTSELLSNSMQL